MLMMIGVIGFLISSLAGVPRTSIVGETTTRAALKQGKEALIARAVLDTPPGRMPCPEDTSKIGGAYEGDALGSCSNAATLIGRLPWRTLKLEKLTDGYGEPLWYVLSPGFRSAPINSDTPGQLILDDQSDIVALIIAPGPALSGQARTAPTSTTPPAAADYLDLSNKDGNPRFVSTGDSSSFNDRVIVITRAELMAPVERRVAREVRNALLDHFCDVDSSNVNYAAGTCIAAGPGVRALAAPAAINDSSCFGNATISSGCASDGAPAAPPSPLFGRIPANPTTPWEPAASTILRGQTGGSPANWFQQNKWRELVFYAVSQKCVDGTSNCTGTGNEPLVHRPSTADQSVHVVVILSGRALAGQSRSNDAERSSRNNYLESGNATGNTDFYVQSTNATFNDTIESLRLP